MNYQQHPSFQEPNPIRLFQQHLQYLGSESLPESDLEKLYDKDIFVCFDSHAIAIPLNAVAYNALVDFIDIIVKEML